QRIGQREKGSQELEIRLTALEGEIKGHQGNLEGLDRQIAEARERMQEKNQQREQLQARFREREKTIESGRQAILRLLGEASTLKNQLTQIDSYLAGTEREAARATREEQTATAELERLGATRQSLSETMSQRQMELEAVTGEKRRTEEELASRKTTSAELRRI